MALTFGSSAAADTSAAKASVNRPYVEAIKGGTFYARCIPSGRFDSAGTTDIYRVQKEKDEHVAHYDWYSRDGLVLGWSPIAGEVAVMARPNEPAESPEKQMELSFYLGGKFLRSWSTAELEKLGIPAGLAMEETSGARRAFFQFLGWKQIDNSNEYVFSIGFSDGKRASFDILTGDIYRPHKLTQEQAKGLAEEVASGKGIKVEDYALITAQFDARTDEWRLFFSHKPPGYPGGHFTIYVKDETKETRFVGGR